MISQLNAQANRIVAESTDITLTQWRICALIDNLGPVPAAQIVRHCNTDKAQISRAVRKMPDDGYLNSSSNRADQRSTVLSMTDKGSETAEKARTAVRGWEHQLHDRGVPVESILKLHYRFDDDVVGLDEEHIPMQVVVGFGTVWASIRCDGERKIRDGRMLGDYIGPGDSKYTDYDAKVTWRAVDWLSQRGAQQDDQPWCLDVGLIATHFPLIVPQDYVDMYPDEILPEVKLHPSSGYKRHPWADKQNDYLDNEAKFKNAEERIIAMQCYYGLTS